MQTANEFDFLHSWKKKDLKPLEGYPAGQLANGLTAYYGKSFDGRPMFALKGRETASMTPEDLGGGIEIMLFLGKIPEDNMMTFTLQDPSLIDNFASFLQSFLYALENPDDKPDEVLKRYYRQWFVLTYEPLLIKRSISILGEMVLLSKLIDNGINNIKWKRDTSSDYHLTINGDIHVMVRTVISQDDEVVEINVEDLMSSKSDKYFIVFLRLRSNKFGPYSIGNLLKKLPETCFSKEILGELNPKAVETIRSSWLCEEEKVFIVDSNFPIVKLDTLHTINSNAVSDIRYKVNLGDLHYIDLCQFAGNIKGGEHE